MVRITYDYEKLVDFLSIVKEAEKNHVKIFESGWRYKILPQFQLPPELEYDPIRSHEVRFPKEASRFLYLRCSIDRISQSKALLRFARDTWNNPNTKWIFNPEEVVRKNINEVEYSLKSNFHYNVPIKTAKNGNVVMSAGEGYWLNCNRLVSNFGGDLRNLIQGRTTSEIFLELIENHYGVGDGISKLICVEMHSRRIASPSDCEGLEIKLDRWKTALLFNLGIIKFIDEKVHYTTVKNLMKGPYKRALEEVGLSGEDADGILWAISSMVCARKDESLCDRLCPLYEPICETSVNWGRESSFMTRTQIELDNRKPLSQLSLSFFK